MVRPLQDRSAFKRRAAPASGAVAAAVALLLLVPGVLRADEGTDLLGPLRIRDMTPFNILRLDMLPAHAVAAGAGSWAVEADISYTNTYVMSDNVRDYLQRRGKRSPLSQADVNAIMGLGQDAYYVDGEFGLLDLTLHYAPAADWSVYVTLPAYSFGGGFLDRAIEGFHGAIGNGPEGRDLTARDQFQTVLSIRGSHTAFLSAPIEGGLGDPIFGVRRSWRPPRGRWGLVVDGAAKIAVRDERSLLSTGTNDYGVQASLQGKFRRQGLYFSGSLVRTDGRVLGVPLGSRQVPTLTGAYEVAVAQHTNLIVQLYASQSALRDTSIEQIRRNKYQASLGARSHRGRFIYGFAITENVANFENTPDVGVSTTLAWASLRKESRP